MLRHVVLIRWRQNCPEEAIRRAEEGLGRLPGQIPSIRAYSFGRDLGLRPGNLDFAIVADFDDQAGYAAYATDPRHLLVISELIDPWWEERRAVQFVLPQ